MKLFFGEIYPEVKINEDEQQHILKVLRMKDGDEIHLTDGKGNIIKGLLKIEGKKARLNGVQVLESQPRFSPYLHIAIAPTKNIDRIEFFIEKAVEMGISEITFLLTDNSERKVINIEKVMKQVIAASKQSLRYHFPKINPLTKLSDFLHTVQAENTYVAHCDESLERIPLQQLPQQNSFTFLVGPEGDFSKKEIEILITQKIKAVTLGNQRLRTETAGIYLAAWNYFKI